MSIDPINPPWYTKNGVESITLLETFVPDKPYRWPAMKYLLRAGKKPSQDETQDLRKAIWWIEREIAKIAATPIMPERRSGESRRNGLKLWPARIPYWRRKPETYKGRRSTD